VIIVGEQINTSRKRIARAVEARDRDAILEVARAQKDAGADFIDVNAGTFLGRETECLCWLVETIQAEVEGPLCLDSPNPDALGAAIERHRGEPLINSISLEEERWDALLPVVTGHPCQVVALCMSADSMPRTTEDKVQVATDLVERLTVAGVARERVLVDPLVQPVSVDPSLGPATLAAIERIRVELQVRTICGLSNVSFGLPERRLINRTFLTLALGRGLSAAILDPTDRGLMAALLAAEMVLDRDEFCERYLDAYGDGRLGG
jgi:5-methyltetrahydrofolate--homocysteine methyltransferase